MFAMDKKVICDDCGIDCAVYASSVSTGYGTDSSGKHYCFPCCGKRDVQQMIADGKIALYLSDGHVTNWPGTLKFRVTLKRKGRHNIAGTRYDVWFNGPDSHVWHGVTYGDDTEICHCKRTKEVSR